MREARELRDPTDQFAAAPLEDNLFEWHFTIAGPAQTAFEGGRFHGGCPGCGVLDVCWCLSDYSWVCSSVHCASECARSVVRPGQPYANGGEPVLCRPHCVAARHAKLSRLVPRTLIVSHGAGRILLPTEYPMKPPSIILLTPNGRFEVGKKICLTISAHHPESWQPSWSSE